MPATRSVSVVTLGCARNEVDSEELAGRLESAGWRLVEEAEEADVAVVNTCGFVEQAKKDSIDTLIEAASMRDSRAETGVRTQAVVAVGCLAERYGKELADSLPEADAVLGFDSYADLSTHLDAVLRGDAPQSHVPRDRRTLLPISPSARAARRMQLADLTDLPDGIAPATGPRVVRRRLGDQPWAPLKLASGCDRRCTFCAIPAFRGAFVSRPPAEVLTEAAWLAERGVSELFLVSENSTSYGKDLGDLRLLEGLLPRLAAIDGVRRVRVSYLQPAELRPGLLEAIASTEGVAPYFDLSFQHSAPGVLRRMRRFGGTDDFLTLLEKVRARRPEAGVRSNVIVGFPGETDEDVEELCRFLTGARLDVVGVFGYSDEDGTAAADLDGKLSQAEIAARVAHVGDLVEELSAQRAQDRIGEIVDVLVEGSDEDDHEDGRPTATGRSAHQGPEVDGLTLLPGVEAKPGDWVRAAVVDSSGVDLISRPLDRTGGPVRPAGQPIGAQQG